MQRILLVRLSALGDVIHSLPVIADIHRRWPDAAIDVATDERFVEIPLLNRYVRKVIGLPLKRAKKNIFNRNNWKSLRSVIRELRQEEYDVVVDLHGLIKSAVVTRLARGALRVGFDASQCAEKPAAWCYNQHFLPSEIPHRVDWLRQLAAFAVNSDCGQPLDYGFAVRPSIREKNNKIVFFHSTSCGPRLWPEEDWVVLGKRLIKQGFRIELPWGSESEQVRALRLQQMLGPEFSDLSPLRSLPAWVDYFHEVALVVGLDTGLTHLAAAAGAPCVGIFTLTCSNLLVPQNPERARVIGGNGLTPTGKEVAQVCEILLNEMKAARVNASKDRIEFV